MAFGVKHWVGAALAGCALVAVWNLPPEPFSSRRAWLQAPPAALPEQTRYTALMDQTARARVRLRQYQWSDSLSAEVVARAGDGNVVLVEGAETLPPAVLDALDVEFRREVDAIPHRRADVVLGAVVQSASHGDHPADWTRFGGMGMTSHLFFGRRDGVTYCFGVDPSQGPPRPSDVTGAFGRYSPIGTRTYNMLGVCRWVAELGLPGPGITRWLQAGAYLMADEGQAQERPSEPLSALGLFYGQRWRVGPLGMGQDFSPWGACQAGREEACAASFLRTRESSVMWGGWYPASWLQESEGIEARPEEAWFAWRILGRSSSLTWVMADLYAEFGKERVEAFWTHPGEPEVAFQDAFGTEVGAWMTRWTKAKGGFVPPGPLPRARAVLWAMATLAFFAGLAVVSGRRRTVV